METADVIVIGSGQGGIPFATDCALSGQKVVLFERDALGGSCVNYGCTPSKAFLAASCYRCNEFKGARTEAIDPEIRQLVPLFNPRTQNGSEEFVWGNGGTHVIGITPIGRATVIA